MILGPENIRNETEQFVYQYKCQKVNLPPGIYPEVFLSQGLHRLPLHERLDCVIDRHAKQELGKVVI